MNTIVTSKEAILAECRAIVMEKAYLPLIWFGCRCLAASP